VPCDDYVDRIKARIAERDIARCMSLLLAHPELGEIIAYVGCLRTSGLVMLAARYSESDR
jgi:hypothetical protein